MADVISRTPELIEQGEKFAYDNFASKNPRGFPAAYSEGWLVWAHHLTGLITEMDKVSNSQLD